MEQNYSYKSEIQEVPQIRKDLTALSAMWKIPTSESNQIEVIIEELFSNIIRFAYRDNLEHLIEVRLGKNESEISIEMIDDGIPFNPLEQKREPLTDPANSDAGGMGLTLIQTFSDAITYNRIGKKNHLNIIKKIKSQP